MGFGRIQMTGTSAGNPQATRTSVRVGFPLALPQLIGFVSTMMRPHPRDCTHWIVMTSCGIHTRDSISRITAPSDCRYQDSVRSSAPIARAWFWRPGIAISWQVHQGQERQLRVRGPNGKKFTARVFPGVLLTFANFSDAAGELISEGFADIGASTKAISGKLSAGNVLETRNFVLFDKLGAE